MSVVWAWLQQGRRWVVRCLCRRSFVIGARRFRVDRLLATGGFANVYEVVAHSGERLAVKRLVVQSEEQAAAAQEEIRVHRLIGSHNANCIALLAHETRRLEGGNQEVLLLFPLYSRGTVLDLVLRKASAGEELTDSQVLSLLEQVARGLLQFHGLQPALAHRDVKPHNVLLGGNNEAVLMDFGSASLACVDTSSRRRRLGLQERAAVFCSMPYRAPELWEPVDDPTCVVDERTDTWSLGCLVFALAFGQGYSPFECAFPRNSGPFRGPSGSSGAGIARAVARECSYLAVIGDVRLPERHTRPQGLVDLMQAMLTVAPTQRPTVRHVLERARALSSQDVLIDVSVT